jgi:hypothetical protein
MTRMSSISAVFDEDGRARLAVWLLGELGFGPRQVGYVARHGELLEATGTLSAVDVPEHDVVGGLITVGVPRWSARDLGGEFERGRSIVTVRLERTAPHVERAMLHAGAVSVTAH